MAGNNTRFDGIVTADAAENGGAPGANGAPVEERRKYDVDEHLMTVEQVAEKYGLALNPANLQASGGLTAEQVAQAKARFGPNALTPPAEKPEWLKFLLQFTNPLMVLLIIAGGLLFMAYGIQVSVKHSALSVGGLWRRWRLQAGQPLRLRIALF